MGRLPKRWGWEQVISSLASREMSEDFLLSATARAAQKTISDAKRLDSLAVALWTFLDLANASRSGSLVSQISQRGVAIAQPLTGFGLIKAISTLVERDVRRKPSLTALDEIALQTFDSVVLGAIREQSRTLFGCTTETVQAAFRELSSKFRVAAVGRRFFSEFTYRALRLALERELARSLGKQGRFESSADLSRFEERLQAYCWDVSKIVEEFSGGWYSKAVWEHRLTLDEARGFTAYAVEKLLSELGREKTKV